MSAGSETSPDVLCFFPLGGEAAGQEGGQEEGRSTQQQSD